MTASPSLNTTLRTIGRPADLRDRLFARTLAVRMLVPLPDPGQVFGGLPAVDGMGWRIVSPMVDRERLITGTRS